MARNRELPVSAGACTPRALDWMVRVATVLLVGAALLGMSRAHAAAILFNDFSTLNGMQVNGNAQTIHSCAASGAGSTCSSITGVGDAGHPRDRKSTRLNSSH